MRLELQQAIIARFLAHFEAGTTDVAPAERVVNVDRYLSDSRFAAEQTHLFRRLPLILVESTALRQPGDFLTSDRLGVPLLLTRTSDGTVHAFLNACTHRGAKLTTAENGCSHKAFRCPYHGWTFGNDGSLLQVTRSECFPDLDRNTQGLVPFPTEERHGLIWGVLTPGAPLDLDGFLGELQEDLAWMDPATHVAYRPFERHVKANWKIVLEGFQEQYHLPYAHQHEVYSYFPDVMVHDRIGLHQRLAGARQTMRNLAKIDPSRWRLRPCASIGYSVCPHTMLLVHPDHIAMVRVYPVTVDSCDVHWLMLIPQSTSDDSWVTYWDRVRSSHHMTFAEDAAIAEGVQAAIRSGALTTCVFGRNEIGVIGGMDSLDTALQAGLAGDAR